MHKTQQNTVILKQYVTVVFAKLVIYYIIWHDKILYYIILYYIILYYTILYYTILYYTILYYITLHYITLHYITLHYIQTAFYAQNTVHVTLQWNEHRPPYILAYSPALLKHSADAFVATRKHKEPAFSSNTLPIQRRATPNFSPRHTTSCCFSAMSPF
jgi:hypothetical protein